jgi:hypothetical protein
MISKSLKELQELGTGRGWIATKKRITVTLLVAECVLQNPCNAVDSISTVGWTMNSVSPREALHNLSREFAKIRFWLYTAADATDDQNMGPAVREVCFQIEELIFPLSLAESRMKDHVAQMKADWWSWTAMRATCKGIHYVLPNPQHNSFVQICGMNSRGGSQDLFHIASLQKLNIGEWREQLFKAIEHTRSMHRPECKDCIQCYPELQWLQSANLQAVRMLRIIVMMRCECFTVPRAPNVFGSKVTTSFLHRMQ